MQDSSPTRRSFIQWTVSSFVLPPALANAKLADGDLWAGLSVERRSGAMFGALLPRAAKHVCTATGAGVLAAIYEVEAAENSALDQKLRWLCIASEISPGKFSIQTTDKALSGSDAFHPVEIELHVADNGRLEVSEQGLRSHTQHSWTNVGGKWCLAGRDFAGVVAHEMVTERFDAQTQEVVTTRGKLEDDIEYFSQCSKAETLVELGAYRNGESLA